MVFFILKTNLSKETYTGSCIELHRKIFLDKGAFANIQFIPYIK